MTYYPNYNIVSTPPPPPNKTHIKSNGENKPVPHQRGPLLLSLKFMKRNNKVFHRILGEFKGEKHPLQRRHTISSTEL